MPFVEARARAGLDRLGSEPQPVAVASPAPAPPSTPATAAPAFRLMRSGSRWTLEHGGRSVELRDLRGLAMLARLVAEPGREFACIDLVAVDGVIDAGDAGEVLDAKAREAYRARVHDLREQIEEAEIGRAHV